MSLITSDYAQAVEYAYHRSNLDKVAMGVYSRPFCFDVDIDTETDIEDKQYIVTPNISEEVPDHWTLEYIIGAS